MRFTTELPPLLAAVKRAASTVESRRTIPILGCVHIAATDTGLRITGTNLDQTITASCDASVGAHGSLCVDAALLLAWLSQCPKGALIDASLIDGRLVLRAGRGVANFAVFDASDFPLMAKSEADAELVGAIDAILTCLSFVSDEETRYFLNGVAISQGHAVATNGRIACAIKIAAPDDLAAIIPARAVKVLSQCSPAARLWVGSNTWRCEDASAAMQGKMIDDTFPDWTRIMPGAAVLGSFDADAMSSAVSQVVMASGERARAIKIVAGKDGMTLECRGDVMTATSVLAYDGEPFNAGLNAKYAQIGMAVFDGRVVSIAKDIDGPMLLTSEALPGVRVAIMGMRI